MVKKKWIGDPPVNCDRCRKPLVGTFIDGRTHFGWWANMCEKCHTEAGVGLGLGAGQMYNLTTLEKIGG